MASRSPPLPQTRSTPAKAPWRWSNGSAVVACPQPTGPTLTLADIKLEAPLPVPHRNIICVGRNYHAHAREPSDSVFKNNQPEAWPIIFTKVPETVIGPNDTVRLPGAAVSTQIDYEAELTIIIGKGGRNIAPEQASNRQQITRMGPAEVGTHRQAALGVIEARRAA